MTILCIVKMGTILVVNWDLDKYDYKAGISLDLIDHAEM